KAGPGTHLKIRLYLACPLPKDRFRLRRMATTGNDWRPGWASLTTLSTEISPTPLLETARLIFSLSSIQHVKHFPRHSHVHITDRFNLVLIPKSRYPLDIKSDRKFRSREDGSAFDANYTPQHHERPAHRYLH